jgi:hypothetical protein
MMPSPLLKTVASAGSGCSPGMPVMTVMKPVPTTLSAGHAALPICWNCSSVAAQAGTAEPSNTVPAGAPNRNRRTGEGFAFGSFGFL